MPTVVYESDQIFGNQDLIASGAYSTFTMHKVSGSFPSGGYRITRARATFQIRNAGWDTLTFYAGSINLGTEGASGTDGNRIATLKTGYDWPSFRQLRITGGDQGTQLAAGSYVTVTVDWAYTAGTIETDQMSVEAGESVSFTIGNFSQSNTYTLDVMIGDSSIHVVHPSAASFSVPALLEWCELIPTKRYVWLEYRLSTYTGDTVTGQSSVKVQYNVPVLGDNDKPSVTITNVTEAADRAVFGDLLVQEHCALQVEARADGVNGASILMYQLEIGSRQYGWFPDDDGDPVLRYFDAGNDQPARCRYIDSRGYYSAWTDCGTLTILPYAAPTIQGIDCDRADADGNEDAEGEYINCVCDYRFSYIGSCEPDVSVKIADENMGWTQIASGSYGSGYPLIALGNGTIRKEKQYTLLYEISDPFGNVARMTYEIPAGQIFLRMDARNKRVGFGTYPQQAEKTVEIQQDWSLYTHGQEIVDLIDSRIPEPEPIPEPEKAEHWHFGTATITSNPNTLATNTTQTYTASVTVPAGAEVHITGVALQFGTRVALWGYPAVSVSGTTATFSLTVRNDGANALYVAAHVYYAYKEP